MSFFPSDWEDEDFEENYDSFQGDVDGLVSDFESKSRDTFTARELIELFRYYSSQIPDSPDHFHSEKYARMVIEIGIQKFPYIPIFTLHMVEWLMRENKYRKAHKYLEQATAYTPFEPSLMMMKSILLSHEGARKLAFDILNNTIEIIGDDDALLEDFLDMVLHYEQFDLAEPIAKKAIKVDADIIPILEKYLSKTEESHIIEMLIPAIEAQIDKDPYMAEAWFVLGSAQMALSNYEKALTAQDYAVTINDNFADAWHALAECHYELQHFQIVIDIYENLTIKFPKKSLEPIDGLYAWSLHEVGNSIKSREVYKQILKRSPNDAECWYSLGLTLQHENQFNIAIAYLEKAYQLDPTEADYGIVLAAAYFGDNQTEKWQNLYEEISDAFPFEPELWLDWGVALYETGQTEKALNITETALENNPHSIHLLYRLSALCYLSGNHDLSLMVLEKALEFDSDEYHTMFIFAPELKKSVKIMALITKFVQTKSKNE
jgi:tetratricopeptide (TPR) repeat protein